MAIRARTHGIKIFGGTLTPFENETFMIGAFTPEGEAKPLAVNQWIRNSGAFDGVIDFDAGLRDPDHPARMLPAYDNGDHLHPSDAGLIEWVTRSTCRCSNESAAPLDKTRCRNLPRQLAKRFRGVEDACTGSIRTLT